MKLKKYLLVLLPLVAFILVGCGLFNGEEEIEEEILLEEPTMEEFAPDDMWMDEPPMFEEAPFVDEDLDMMEIEEEMMNEEPEMLE